MLLPRIEAFDGSASFNSFTEYDSTRRSSHVIRPGRPRILVEVPVVYHRNIQFGHDVKGDDVKGTGILPIAPGVGFQMQVVIEGAGRLTATDRPCGLFRQGNPSLTANGRRCMVIARDEPETGEADRT
jgi:hypothetical protein